MENNITVKTPYAYAFGVILVTIQRQLTELDREMKMDVATVKTLAPILLPGVIEKHRYCADKIIALYNQLSEAFDMIIPDDEKAILDKEYMDMAEKYQDYLNSK